MRAVLYLRQSLDLTGDELAVTRQKEDCLTLAERRHWNVIGEYVDNDRSASGKVKRPEFENLLTEVNAGRVDVVVAWNLDRLTRNRRDTVRLIETCQEHRVVIGLARGSDLDMSTPMGRMMADQLAGWARYEIEQKSDRHIRANEQKAKAGKPHGSRRPFGYEADLVTIRDSEAATLREMARRMIGGHSAKEIAAWANRCGHVTSQGRSWYPVTVSNMLQKKRYAGIRSYKGTDYPGTWPGVFDSETWERLQLTIKLRSVSNVPKARKYLLTGLVQCGVCGHNLNGSVKRDRPSAPPRRTYACHTDTGCGKIRRNADALDHYITESVLYRLDTPELGVLLTSGEPNDEQLKWLLSDRDLQAKRIEGLVDDYATGLLSKAQLARAKSTAEAELERIDHDIGRMNRERRGVGMVPPGQTLQEAWERSESDNWRRELISLVIKKIIVNPGNTKPFYILPDGRVCRFDSGLIEILWSA